MKKTKKLLLAVLSVLTAGLCMLGASGCGETKKGEQGIQGVGIENIEVNEEGRLVITLTDGTIIDDIELPAVSAEKCEHKVENWYAVDVEEDLTCTDLLFYGKCTLCGEAVTQVGMEHVFGESTYVKPTCTSEGYDLNTCTVCWCTEKTNITEALNHNFGEWSEYIPATCLSTGENRKYCTRDNCFEYESEEVGALGHNEQDIVVQPTCASDGYTQHGCTRCSYNRVIDTYIVAPYAHYFENGVCKNCACPQGVIKENAPNDMEYKLGDVMYDFTVTTSDDSIFTLSEILEEKKAVVISFWATWCGPCKSEFPAMNNAYYSYQDDISILAMSTTDDDTAVKNYKATSGLLFDMCTSQAGLTSMFSTAAVPTTIMIDRNGVIVFYHTGSMTSVNDFTEKFEVLIAEDYQSVMFSE